MFHWFRRRLPATPPREDFMVRVRVALTTPLRTEQGDEAPGYYKVFGVRATPDSLAALVEATVADGVVDWADATIDPTHVDRAARDITKRLIAPLVEGVWHESGRIYYLDDDPVDSDGGSSR